MGSPVSDKKVLITGASGFFGGILKRELCKEYFCVNLDLLPDDFKHGNLISVQGDIRDAVLVQELFTQYHFTDVIHCAAKLAHDVKNNEELWTSNVDGTEVVIKTATLNNVKSFIFTSTNCLWGQDFKKPIDEQQPPKPVEIYGRSKQKAEEVIEKYKDKIPSVIIFRSPTIIDEGRLGLLGILFEFIFENRKLWIIGDGENKYQFIYAKDYVSAIYKALNSQIKGTYNIGSDNVKSFNAVYGFLINKTSSKSKIVHLPKAPCLLLLQLAHLLRVSPIGPYQYKMIAGNFIFNTDKLKQSLNWTPTLSNEEILYKAYDYYQRNKSEIYNRNSVSSHRQVAKMGILRLLKWLS